MAADDCDARARGGRMLKDAGYKKKRGGKAPGERGKDRPDRRARGGNISMDQPDDAMGNEGARSARAKGGKVGRGKVEININAAPAPAPMLAPHPPMAGPPAGAMPPRPPMAPQGPPPGGGMPAGAGMPPGGGMRPPMPPPGGAPMMPHARGGMVRRDGKGRFSGGSV